MARYKFISIIIVFFVVTFSAWRWWQGPLLPGYTLVARPLVQTVVATGKVASMSRTQVSSEITSVVLERRVQEGDFVTQGDVLLVLRSDDIAAQVRQAEAELAELVTSRRPQASVALANAKIQLAQAEREVTRRRELSERSLLPTEALEQAEQTARLARNALATARLMDTALAPDQVEERLLRERLISLQAQFAKTRVRSEVSGTVLTRNVETGDLVQPGRVLFTIAQAGSTQLLVQLDERNLSRLALQQKAVAIADAYPDKPFSAFIHFIAPSIDPLRGTVQVKLTVEPVPDFVRQDMTVSVNIQTAQRDKTLVIANDALGVVRNQQAQVLLVRNGKLHRQRVTLGLRGLALSEVVTGLHVGDQVLADPLLTLPEGARVRFSELKMLQTSDTLSATLN